MIVTSVSSQDDCIYCQSCHGSTAAQHLGGSDADYDLIASMKQNYEATAISSKMKSLLAIGGKLQKAGKHVTGDDVARNPPIASAPAGHTRVHAGARRRRICR